MYKIIVSIVILFALSTLAIAQTYTNKDGNLEVVVPQSTVYSIDDIKARIVSQNNAIAQVQATYDNAIKAANDNKDRDMITALNEKAKWEDMLSQAEAVNAISNDDLNNILSSLNGYARGVNWTDLKDISTPSPMVNAEVNP